MSEPLKSVHVRLSSEVHAKLRAIADLNDKDLAEICERIISTDVLGSFHDLKTTAERFQRLGILRDSEGAVGSVRE